MSNDQGATAPTPALDWHLRRFANMEAKEGETVEVKATWLKKVCEEALVRREADTAKDEKIALYEDVLMDELTALETAWAEQEFNPLSHHRKDVRFMRALLGMPRHPNEPLPAASTHGEAR